MSCGLSGIYRSEGESGAYGSGGQTGVRGSYGQSPVYGSGGQSAGRVISRISIILNEKLKLGNIFNLNFEIREERSYGGGQF